MGFAGLESSRIAYCSRRSPGRTPFWDPDEAPAVVRATNLGSSSDGLAVVGDRLVVLLLGRPGGRGVVRPRRLGSSRIALRSRRSLCRIPSFMPCVAAAVVREDELAGRAGSPWCNRQSPCRSPFGPSGAGLYIGRGELGVEPDRLGVVGERSPCIFPLGGPGVPRPI